MEIGITQTVSGQWRIVDAGDNEEGTPLVSFHNEFNHREFVEMVFNFLTENGSKKNITIGLKSE